MRTEQRRWSASGDWLPSETPELGDATLVFAFGETALLKNTRLMQQIRDFYPRAQIVGCSTAGEIQGAQVFDNSITVTAVKFERTTHKLFSQRRSIGESSFDLGARLALGVDAQNLSHILVFSVGLNLNGGELVRGLREHLPPKVTMTGGLAGDQNRFIETLVLTEYGVSDDSVVVLGLYGANVKVNSASLGGWDAFGPERVITKSSENILFELDGKSALDVYKEYLGDQFESRVGGLLHFPLALEIPGSQDVLVRSVLSVDPTKQALVCAGDVPMGSVARFMMSNVDRLVDGAIGAAERCQRAKIDRSPDLAILISCVGRRIVLRQRIEEELEGVRAVFGDETVMTGFYSYGEIASFKPHSRCELHNQTMTITTISEDHEKTA